MPLENKGLEIGQPGPDWELTSVEGNTFSSQQFRGRPLLLFFFRGTWCPSCRSQMELIKANWEQIETLADAVGIVGEDPAQTRAFLANTAPLPFVLLPDPNRKVIEGHNIYRRFALDGFRVARPTTLILDSEGIVRYCYVGTSQFDRPDMSEIIGQLIKVPLPKR